LRQLNHHRNHVKLFRAAAETLARKHHHFLCVVRALVLHLRSAGARSDVPPMIYVAREMTVHHRDYELVDVSRSKYVVRALVLHLHSAGARSDVPPKFYVAREMKVHRRDYELAVAHLHSDREYRDHQMVFPHPCAVACRKDSKHLCRESCFLLQRAVIQLYCGLRGLAGRGILLWQPWTLA
jgi:hypothetical protein